MSVASTSLVCSVKDELWLPLSKNLLSCVSHFSQGVPSANPVIRARASHRLSCTSGNEVPFDVCMRHAFYPPIWQNSTTNCIIRFVETRCQYSLFSSILYGKRHGTGKPSRTTSSSNSHTTRRHGYTSEGTRKTIPEHGLCLCNRDSHCNRPSNSRSRRMRSISVLSVHSPSNNSHSPFSLHRLDLAQSALDLTTQVPRSQWQ